MAIHRNKRRVLFYSLAGVFLIITPLVIALAVGNSLSIRGLSLVPTGGIFVKTNQAGVRIMLDGRQYKQTSFLISGALLSNIKPGTHRVRIEKEGYRPWEKTVLVRHGIVSEYREILLIPIEPPEITARAFTFNDTFAYFVSPGGSKNAILLPKETKLILQNIVSGELFFQKKLAKYPEHIEWIDDSLLLVRASSDRSEAHLFRVFPDERVEEIIIRFLQTLKRQAVLEIRRDPTDSRFLLVLGEDHGIYRYRIADGAIEAITSQAMHFETYNERIGFITEQGFFATADVNGKDIQVVERPGFFVNGAFASYPSESGDLIAVTDGVAGFFVFQESERSIAPVTAGVKDVSFNEKNTKALLQRERDMLVLFLEKENIYPFRERLSFAKIIGDEKHELIDSAWYSDSYVLFTTSAGLFGAEIGIGEGDYMVQKIAPEGGYISTDGSMISVVNGKGIFSYAIE